MILTTFITWEKDMKLHGKFVQIIINYITKQPNVKSFRRNKELEKLRDKRSYTCHKNEKSMRK